MPGVMSAERARHERHVRRRRRGPVPAEGRSRRGLDAADQRELAVVGGRVVRDLGLVASLDVGVTADPDQAVGLLAARLAPMRAMLWRLIQPRYTRPKSSAISVRIRMIGRTSANSTRLWPRDLRSPRAASGDVAGGASRDPWSTGSEVCHRCSAKHLSRSLETVRACIARTGHPRGRDSPAQVLPRRPSDCP